MDLFLDLSLRQSLPPFDKQGWTGRFLAVFLRPVVLKFFFIAIFLYSNFGHLLKLRTSLAKSKEIEEGALDKLAKVVLQKKPKELIGEE